MHIWLKPTDEALAKNAIFAPVNASFSDWIMALHTPICGAKPEVAGDLLNVHLQSFAFIPLSKEPAKKLEKENIFGVLILSAEDSQRFKTSMGTLYLERIGSLVSAALQHYL